MKNKGGHEMNGSRPPKWVVGILLVAVLLLVGALVAIFLSASGQLPLDYGVILLVLGWIVMAAFFVVARRYARPAKGEPAASKQE
jgi:uncharacterized membrane-anchored protein